MRTLAAVVLLASLSQADSWSPPTKALYMDEANRYLVLVDPTGPGHEPDFVFARAAKPRPAPDKNKRGRDTGPRPVLGKDDVVLAKGTLPQTPYYVVVSTSGLGFAVIENYMMLGYGYSVIWVSSAGHFTAGAELPRLYSKEEMEDFGRSVSSIWWLADSWLDEGAGKVIVVATNALARTVSFRTGQVAPASAEELLRAAGSGKDHARAAADCLVVGAESFPARPLEDAYSDEKAAPFARLVAAAALSARGDKRGRKLLDDMLAWKGGPALKMGWDAQAFVVTHLPRIFREEAPRLLRAKLETGLQTEEAVRGLVQLGPAGIATLIEVAGSTGTQVLARHEAIKFFEQAEVAEAVPTLARIAWEKEGLVGGSAVTALGHIRAPEARAALLELLRKGCPHVEELTLALFWHRGPETRAAMLEGLSRWPKGSKELAHLESELKELEPPKRAPGEADADWRKAIEEAAKPRP